MISRERIINYIQPWAMQPDSEVPFFIEAIRCLLDNKTVEKERDLRKRKKVIPRPEIQKVMPADRSPRPHDRSINNATENDALLSELYANTTPEELEEIQEIGRIVEGDPTLPKPPEKKTNLPW